MEIKREGNYIIVIDGDVVYQEQISSEAQTLFGANAGMTIGEAYDRGVLFVQDDDLDGDSHGMHGSLYVII